MSHVADPTECCWINYKLRKVIQPVEIDIVLFTYFHELRLTQLFKPRKKKIRRNRLPIVLLMTFPKGKREKLFDSLRWI